MRPYRLELLPLVAAIGCAMPVAYARTGRVLEKGSLRLNAATTTGIAPTTAHVTDRDPSTGMVTGVHTYRSDSPAQFGGVNTFAMVLFAPSFSQELGAAVSPFGTCELGALLGFLRAGVELRCGARFGALDAAISGAAASPLAARPKHPELRGGIDLSLGRANIVPLLDVYFGYVPWRRTALYDDPDLKEWTGINSVSLDRVEYRLSIPIGVAFVQEPQGGDTIRARVIVAVIPEFTLAAHDLESPVTQYGTTLIDQRWAIFLALRIELEVLPPPSTTNAP